MKLHPEKIPPEKYKSAWRCETRNCYLQNLKREIELKKINYYLQDWKKETLRNWTEKEKSLPAELKKMNWKRELKKKIDQTQKLLPAELRGVTEGNSWQAGHWLAAIARVAAGRVINKTKFMVANHWEQQLFSSPFSLKDLEPASKWNQCHENAKTQIIHPRSYKW